MASVSKIYPNIIPVPSNRKPFTMVVGIQTNSPQTIGILAKDAKKPYKYRTYYVRRKGVVNGYREFELKFPQSPEKLTVGICNLRNGMMPIGQDNTFRVVKLQLKDLNTCPIWMNPETTEFLKFAKKFSENASVYSAETNGKGIPDFYASDDGNFKIAYFNQIRDRKTGKVVNTPARIGHKTGIIEVSKEAFMKYTVPMRMIILLHEFSHKYLNPKIGKSISYETGADINALNIYLSEGYSEIEAHQAFLFVFRGARNHVNHKRYLIIKDFINKHSKGKIHGKCGVNYANKGNKNIITRKIQK